MKRILGYLLLIISGFIAYQSYANSQPSPQLESQSKVQACAGADGCEVKDARPNVIQTNIVARRYQWATSNGPVVVSCERQYLWFGEWSCASAPGQLAY